ncbi:MAG: ABC transporter ATP-binding protein [Phycisphaerae bacterium]|nr:ABC transporter ATP-binding protein [Phycisphaerae bacterium]
MIEIALDSLTKRFGDVIAVNDVSIHIDAGELFFLLGPSGCGKTTLLRCVAGFWTPDAGSIRFGQKDITNVPPHRRNTGMVFQNYALWPHLTVRENVAFGLRVRKVARPERQRRVDEALERVQMGRFASRKPNELSGGQQQRVALARALVIEPQCLLLDEPLSNLDAKLRLEMRGEIRRICKQAGLTAIYVTHDQKEALSIADRIAVMNDGRVAQIGTPHDLYARPGSRFVADFLGETNFVQGQLITAEAGSAQVKTSFGMLHSAAAPERRKPGDRVLVSIRPESVRIGKPSGDAVNVFEAAIGETVYLGEVAQRTVTIEGGPTFKVIELNPKIDRQGKATCIVDPTDVVILDEPDWTV